MICPKCGSNIENGNNICPNCGSTYLNENGVINQNIDNITSIPENQLPNEENYITNNPNQLTSPENLLPNNESQISNPENLTSSSAEVKIDKPKKKKKHGFLIFLIILIIIIAGIVIAVKLLNKEKPEDELIFEKEYKYLMMDSENNFIIKHAPKDIVFFLTDDAEYEVYDEYGDKVNTSFEDYKMYNPNGYEEGKTYIVNLKSGKFMSSELADTTKVTFTIERKESNKYTYNKKDKFVDSSSIKLDESGTSFTSKNKYNDGDVIILGNKESFNKAYYITSSSDNTYYIRDASLDEIYSELDIYKEEVVDLSNFENSEAIKEFLIADVKTSDWYLSLIPEVKAEPKIGVNIKPTEKGVEATLNVTIKPNENSKFFNSKYHEFSFVITEKLSMTAQYDITLSNWDVTFDIVNKSDVKLKINNTFLDYKSIINNKITKQLLDDIQNKTHGYYDDSHEGETPLTKIVVPTSIPGLNNFVDLSLVNSLNGSVSLDGSYGVTKNLTVGIDAGINEELKTLGNFSTQKDGLNVKIAGNVTDKIGLSIGVGAELINTFSVSFNAEGGIYNKGSFEVKYNSETNKFEGDKSIEFGLYAKVYVQGKALNKTVNGYIFDKEFPLLNNESPFAFSEDAEGNIVETSLDNSVKEVTNEYKYEDLYEANSCILFDGDDYEKIKFNLYNGELKSATITVKITVDTGYEALDNLLRFILAVYNIILDMQYHCIGYSYSEGKDVYMIFHLSASTLIEDQELDDDASYPAVKSSLVNSGYTCN